MVEAGARSGALTTAAWALEQGRSLYLVPGVSTTRRSPAASPSCARPVRRRGSSRGSRSSWRTSASCAPRRPPARSRRSRCSARCPASRRRWRVHVAAGLASVDELVHATGAASATVLGALTSLEVRGLVVDAFGRYRAAGPLAATERPRPTGDPARVRPDDGAGRRDAEAGEVARKVAAMVRSSPTQAGLPPALVPGCRSPHERGCPRRAEWRTTYCGSSGRPCSRCPSSSWPTPCSSVAAGWLDSAPGLRLQPWPRSSWWRACRRRRATPSPSRASRSPSTPAPSTR